MFACAIVGWFLGRTRGMGLHGFLMGLAFGPLGWGLILLWPTRWIQGPVPRETASGADAGPSTRSSGQQASAAGPSSPAHPPGGGGACPRCRRPVAPDAGACPHCGNVLVPVRYRVNPG